jgi:hypothetical protein
VGGEGGWVGAGEGAVEGGAEGFVRFWWVGVRSGLVEGGLWDLEILRGITNGRVVVLDGRVDGLGLGGSEFMARDGPGAGIECAS